MEIWDTFVPYMEVSRHPAHDEKIHNVPTLLFFPLLFRRGRQLQLQLQSPRIVVVVVVVAPGETIQSQQQLQSPRIVVVQYVDG